MNREIDKTMSADWIRSEANVWKGICVKSDMGIGLVKGLGGRDRLAAIAVIMKRLHGGFSKFRFVNKRRCQHSHTLFQ